MERISEMLRPVVEIVRQSKSDKSETSSAFSVDNLFQCFSQLSSILSPYVSLLEFVDFT